MRKYKSVKCFFEIGIDSKTLEKMKSHGTEETTKLLKLRQNIIKFDSNYGKKGTSKICQKVA